MSGIAKDWTGQKFGRLTFIVNTGKQTNSRCYLWEVLCDCGKVMEYTASHITGKDGIRSCGCGRGKLGKNAKDFTGQKYGHLTFIRRMDKKNGSSYYWEVLCDCGKTCNMLPSQVRDNKSGSCGCLKKTTILDRTGEKHSLLTFIRPVEERQHGSHDVVWELQCDCGSMITRRGSEVVAGKIKSCGCIKIDGYGTTRIYEPIISSARHVWRNSYRDGCPFDIFFALSQKDCFYCGLAPFLTFNIYNQKTNHYASNLQRDFGNFTYNGLDRIDNAKDHSPDNVVPCCWPCNELRGNTPFLEFIKHIRRIANNLKGKDLSAHNNLFY